MKKKVLHFIHRDKFTAGYINWMIKSFPNIKHYFVTREDEQKLDLYEGCEVYYFKNENDIFKLHNIIDIAKKADTIIISGIFYCPCTEIKFLLNVPKSIKKKVFLQFWGGDFYSFRNIHSIKGRINKQIRRRTIKSVRAVIMLLEDDYEQIKNILNVQKEYFVAIMPCNPKDDCKFEYEEKKDDTLRILLGNSATKENQHDEMFENLSKFKNEKIEIICPLSYGDDKYKDEIIKKGNEIYGKKFKPITEFMKKQDYINMLSTCDIGIFNNNRQQALGNIDLMFQLGKKVFIRSDVSTWKYYIRKKFVLYDTTQIKNMTFDEFKEKNERAQLENKKAIDLLLDDSNTVKNWAKVFDI